MTNQNDLEQELKELIVETLMLEDVTSEDIESEEPLFDDGLGLDSIDALELGMAISKKYKIKLSQDPQENHEYFANVRSLAGFVQQKLQSQESAS